MSACLASFWVCLQIIVLGPLGLFVNEAQSAPRLYIYLVKNIDIQERIDHWKSLSREYLKKDQKAAMSIVDWAIIKIVKRNFGRNKSSDLHISSGKLEVFTTKSPTDAGQTLHKLGHATGHTVGTYNWVLDARVAVEHATGRSKITYEHSILTTDSRYPFPTKRDSWLFDWLVNLKQNPKMNFMWMA
ncbi:hypothetical protein BO78DRAFT_381554 [Aspergillus sclerotiicarbonarius CBS 121057]|uniref:Uncharacterized protein n=1 Tax=Aspergillus sclerotiicarbonarius (strain CBS 121057 / IBT 28362) TaxID=1448318 RepID=A0A319EPY0_ASPSB|nr:hypothetical protein BO78DRAFT_381554 [Aspergillus sclerotiicarbonarius CBS 121057]